MIPVSSGGVDPIRCFALLLALSLLALVPVHAPAQELYQWTDEDGLVRYTAYAERVPRAARERALVIRRDPTTGVVSSRKLGTPVVAAAEPEPETLPSVAAAPPAEPALPVPAVGGSWAIELDVRPVSSWLRPLESLGLLERHRLYRVARQSRGQVWQRLRLGFFATPGAAGDVLTRLEVHFPGAWVDRVDAGELADSATRAIAPPGRAEPAVPEHEARYAVQLLASPADERLRALTRLELLDRHRLQRSTVEADGEIWERLVLGTFPSAEAAEAVRRQLLASYPDARVERVDTPELAAIGAEEMALVR